MAMPQICLKAGMFEVGVSPDMGGALTGMWCDGLPVLRSRAVQQSVRDTACYPLVPYSNRIASGYLQWAQQSWVLTPNFPPEPHAIHGTGWRASWSVVDVGQDSVNLRHSHVPDGDWPFAFECEQRISLDSAGLSMRLVFTNLAAHSAPCGLGWHPYFVKDDKTLLRFTAQTRWDMSPDHLPTFALPHAGHDCVATHLTTDHCFSGWSGAASLQTARLKIDLQSSLQNLVVFTRPDRDFIAIEPVSHVNNALGMPRTATELDALGVVVLDPHGTFEARLRIEARPLH